MSSGLKEMEMISVGEGCMSTIVLYNFLFLFLCGGFDTDPPVLQVQYGR